MDSSPETTGRRDTNEASLMAGLRQGDAAVFERMVRTYSPRLYAVALRLLRSEEDARDALQDAFTSAYRSLDGFHEGSRLSTWLHRIVVNASLMKLRRRRRKPEESIETLLPRFHVEGHHLDPPVLWRDSAVNEMVRDENRSLVRDCINRLPENYRTVIMLRDIEGYDTEDAARMLNTSPNAVKVRLHRARQGLRALLEPHFRRMSE